MQHLHCDSLMCYPRVSLAELVIGCEDSLVISFVSKGFPNKDQIEELLIAVFYCMYSQHVTLSTFSLISLFKL